MILRRLVRSLISRHITRHRLGARNVFFWRQQQRNTLFSYEKQCGLEQKQIIYLRTRKSIARYASFSSARVLPRAIRCTRNTSVLHALFMDDGCSSCPTIHSFMTLASYGDECKRPALSFRGAISRATYQRRRRQEEN